MAGDAGTEKSHGETPCVGGGDGLAGGMLAPSRRQSSARWRCAGSTAGGRSWLSRGV
eukprot:CAMPEP_0197607224 /NCGR_PEP_ID=MMETSP1326-20131121/46653_1 /TAXON_ID=1155430 /ORGANISM="Genus nov. species nov., Strain RCC2288" /LENGTH=56 /DNA_ID=CAMNT_0043175265 /DNA_START=65 /DNA_END=235 /DNA_ORIENTATION=+